MRKGFELVLNNEKQTVRRKYTPATLCDIEDELTWEKNFEVGQKLEWLKKWSDDNFPCYDAGGYQSNDLREMIAAYKPFAYGLSGLVQELIAGLARYDMIVAEVTDTEVIFDRDASNHPDVCEAMEWLHTEMNRRNLYQRCLFDMLTNVEHSVLMLDYYKEGFVSYAAEYGVIVNGGAIELDYPSQWMYSDAQCAGHLIVDEDKYELLDK